MCRGVVYLAAPLFSHVQELCVSNHSFALLWECTMSEPPPHKGQKDLLAGVMVVVNDGVWRPACACLSPSAGHLDTCSVVPANIIVCSLWV
jgi:hypothetical protein